MPITFENRGYSEKVSAGSTWLRRNGVLWSQIESERGKYDWSKLQDFEPELLLAAERHVNLIPVIRGTPDWVQKIDGFACGPMRRENFIDFSKFLYEFVNRYGQPPFNLRYVEIWNERDIHPGQVNPTSTFGCWGDKEDDFFEGGNYAEMLKFVYPPVKVANSQVQLITWGLLLDCDPDNVPRHKIDCNSAKFFEGILRNGGRDCFDGVGFHSYDYGYRSYYYENPNWHTSSRETGPVLFTKAAIWLKFLLVEYGVSDKFVFNTETVLLCMSDCETEDHDLALTYYMTHSYAYASLSGLRASLWYLIFGWLGSGLLDWDLTQLPANMTYRFANEKINGKKYIREITDSQGVKIYEFADAESIIWILWGIEENSVTVQLLKIPIAIWDYIGNSQTPKLVLDVTQKPVFIEWDHY